MRISDWSSDVCSSDLGQEYILERGIFADVAIIKGWKADEAGNLVFRKTARNFNYPMATAAKICVAEVAEVVPAGSLDPDCIHLPEIGRASCRGRGCQYV